MFIRRKYTVAKTSIIKDKDLEKAAQQKQNPKKLNRRSQKHLIRMLEKYGHLTKKLHNNIDTNIYSNIKYIPPQTMKYLVSLLIFLSEQFPFPISPILLFHVITIYIRTIQIFS